MHKTTGGIFSIAPLPSPFFQSKRGAITLGNKFIGGRLGFEEVCCDVVRRFHVHVVHEHTSCALAPYILRLRAKCSSSIHHPPIVCVQLFGGGVCRVDMSPPCPVGCYWWEAQVWPLLPLLWLHT